MRYRSESLKQQMTDIQNLLQNLTALQLNGYACAHHHRIHEIVVKGEDGVWRAFEEFPQTVQDFVTLDRELAIGH